MNLLLKQNLIHLKKVALLAILYGVLIQCSSLTTAPFNAYSYQKSIEIKVQTEQLISSATTSFANQKKEVEQLQQQLILMIEYEKYRPNNTISHTMWQQMADPDKNLIGGFIKMWQSQDKLSLAFTKEAKSQINQAFELLITYEANKTKENEKKLIQFLNL